MVSARVPLPVAALLRRARNARSPKERHDAAYFAWEASVRIAAAIAKHEDPEVLARPSLGYWVSVLGRRNEQIRESSLLEACVWFESKTEHAPASIVSARLFDAIPAYRNRVIGHGSVRANDFYEVGAARMIDALLAAWDLGLFLPPQAVVVYVETIELAPSGARRARVLSLMGDAATLEPEGSIDELVLPSRVYVRIGERHAPAHPLLLFADGEGEQRLLFLNGRGRSARYLDYVKGTEVTGKALAMLFPALEPDLAEIPESPADPPPPIVDENVQFTVYRPRSIAAETWVPLLAFAHLSELPPGADPSAPNPLDQVAALAKQALGDRAAAYASVSQDSALALPREGEITFVPELPGITVNPPRRSFLWVEQVHQEQFRICAHARTSGQIVRGRVSVLLGSILLAEVRVTIAVERQVVEAPLEASTARRFRRIFASHALEDLGLVAEFQRYATMLGDQFVSGWSEARGGERWSAEMARTIADADVFQLFWSSHAMSSPMVLRELDFAMSLARPDFIRPLYWQEPLPRDEARGLPPPTLLGIPFLRIGAEEKPPALGSLPGPSPAQAEGRSVYFMSAPDLPVEATRQSSSARWIWRAAPVLALLLLFIALPLQLMMSGDEPKIAPTIAMPPPPPPPPPPAEPPPPPPASEGELAIEVRGVEGATVLIDGAARGTAPLRVTLRAGLHRVVVMSEGAAGLEKDVMVAADELSTVTFEVR